MKNDLKQKIKSLDSPDKVSSIPDLSKLIVISLAGGVGERYVAKKIAIAAENLGWNAIVIPGADQYPNMYKKNTGVY